MKLKTLCERVKANVKWIDANPHMDDMPAGSRHYKVTLRYKGRQMTVPFSMGPALEHEPSSEDVMECLLSDYVWGGTSFEDWASDLGYDTDSRKAERTYRVVLRQTDKLTVFLGSDLDAFMEAER